ncbi:50S ribosomal protein L3, partial [Paenibacillus odorifer]
EIRGVDLGSLEVGQELKADIFAEGEFVDVTGTSKGKGFQGNIKRWGQSRGPMAHGSRYHRRPGSMGSIQANRVPKGKRLPGHMGHTTITVQKLEIIKVDVERNVLLVKGAIPGPKNSFVKVKQTVKK